MLRAEYKKQSIFLLQGGCENARVIEGNKETESDACFPKCHLRTQTNNLTGKYLLFLSTGPFFFPPFLSISPLNPSGQQPGFQMLIHVLDFNHN